jgi:RNA polymerase sigma-70 factor (sigma-E family)
MDDIVAQDDFRAFASARWSPLVGTAYLITIDRGIAEDCAQEALTAVHRRWDRLHADGNPAAYAHRCVVNAALSWRRRRRIREVPLTQEPGRRPGGADEDLAQLGIHGFDARLVQALRSLPPQQRAAVTLRYLEDRSEAETAQLLGCSVGAIKSTTSRAVGKLRVAMGYPGDPPTHSPDDATLTPAHHRRGGSL